MAIEIGLARETLLAAGIRAREAARSQLSIVTWHTLILSTICDITGTVNTIDTTVTIHTIIHTVHVAEGCSNG